jgi:hypothetical protein
VRVLADADLAAVDSDDQHALRGPDMEDDAAAGQPGGGQIEFALVDAGGIDRGQFQRLAGNGIWTLV